MKIIQWLIEFVVGIISKAKKKTPSVTPVSVRRINRRTVDRDWIEAERKRVNDMIKKRDTQ